ncbi:MAG: hypothetical protein ACHQNT_02275 [Bacteroidia bacterium]
MRKHYLPPDDSGRLAWLINFNSKIGGYAALFGITAAETAAIAAYLLMLQYILDLVDAVRSFSQDLTKYKEKLMVAVIGSTLGAPPTITIPVAPATVPAGVFTILSGIVKRIKGGINYTEAIGEDLGIIGADIFDDFASVKPVLKISLDVNHPKIKYKKNRTDGINLYGDHDGRGMAFMRFVSQTIFIDMTELPDAQNTGIYKYMAIHVVDDIEVGIPGDEVAVTVRRIV